MAPFLPSLGGVRSYVLQLDREGAHAGRLAVGVEFAARATGNEVKSSEKTIVYSQRASPPNVFAPHSTVAVNVRVGLFTYTLDVVPLLPEIARSGVLKYSYPGTVSCSVVSQLGPVSKSNTVSATSAPDGSTTGVCIWLQLYAACFAALSLGVHDVSLYTVVPQQSHPAA